MARLASRTPIDVRDRCLCFHAQRAARALARRFDEAFRPVEITNQQFSLMMAMHRSTPPSIGELAEVMVMDRTSVTAAIKPLERRGLVRVAADTSDRRARRPALTSKGRALLARALPIWHREHALLDAGLAPGTRASTLRRGLQALAERPASVAS